jgi:hypothetical protein
MYKQAKIEICILREKGKTGHQLSTDLDLLKCKIQLLQVRKEIPTGRYQPGLPFQSLLEACNLRLDHVVSELIGIQLWGVGELRITE